MRIEKGPCLFIMERDLTLFSVNGRVLFDIWKHYSYGYNNTRVLYGVGIDLFNRSTFITLYRFSCWISKYRKLYKIFNITPDRIERLEQKEVV